MLLIIPIALALLLVSCVGIGDGALFDNITTGEKKESSVPVPEADVFCQIYPGLSPSGTVTTKSIDALTLFLDLSAGNYTIDVDRTAVEKPFFELIYYGPSGKHYVIYEDDFVFAKDDKIDLDTNNSAQYTALGQLDGIYDQTEALYINTLNKVTEEEKAAGFKLNCLHVKMHPGMSRTFFLDEFKDIGGIYLKHLTTSEGYQALVYFESCTPAELEEKIAIVEKISVVNGVAMVGVRSEDPTLD